MHWSIGVLIGLGVNNKYYINFEVVFLKGLCMGMGWYLSLANIKGIFDAISGNVLTKGFSNKKMQCGTNKNDYHNIMHI